MALDQLTSASEFDLRLVLVDTSFSNLPRCCCQAWGPTQERRRMIISVCIVILQKSIDVELICHNRARDHRG